jgi:hypothetical protein
MHGGRNRQRGQQSDQFIALADVFQQAELQHRLGQLFDEQGHAVGLFDDLVQHLGGQRLATGHLQHQLADLGTRQSAQTQRVDLRPGAPGWLEAGTGRRQQQQVGRGHLVDQQSQQFKRGRIQPMQVFHHEQDRLARGHRQQQREDGFQGFPLRTGRRG